MEKFVEQGSVGGDGDVEAVWELKGSDGLSYLRIGSKRYQESGVMFLASTAPDSDQELSRSRPLLLPLIVLHSQHKLRRNVMALLFPTEMIYNRTLSALQES